MLLSKTAYYADFAINAIIIGALTLIAACGADWARRLQWFALLVTGMVAWTLLEYLLHRFVLHQLPIFSHMHAAHHDSPRALVGAPTWLSLTFLWLAIFLPAWRSLSFNVASGLIAGVMLGYLWYGILHHAIHQRRPRLLASRLQTSIHRHLRHHYSSAAGNFGVTTPLWDYLFGTSCRE
ncbi:MAG TPA: sterol desaturase family protein [Steroidobacteraceae bacterium]|nr:sterol desaturase family protein [Steroidobacteraceae bacterium]